MLLAKPWHFRAARLIVQAHLPFGETLRRIKRRQFGYAPDPSNLAGAVAWADRVLALAVAYSRPIQGATALEIGSGWFPVLPMLLAAEGAKRVYMTDVKRHQDDTTFFATAKHLESIGRSRLTFTPLRYLAPFDPAEIPDTSVDLVVSRTVLEHIRPTDLSALLATLRRKMKPGGLHIHLIDNSDHWEHRDKSISRIEFLTRPDWLHNLLWRAIGDGENRLRHSDYRPIFEQAGYRIEMAESKICPRTRSALGDLKLAPPWRDMDPDELAAIESVYVLRAP